MSARKHRIPGTRARNVLYVLPAIPDDLADDLKNALAIRNACAVEGRCPACGATPTLHADDEHPGLLHLVFAHEPDCPAAQHEERST